MVLLSEMRTLTLGLVDSYAARKKAVADLRSNVRQELSEIDADHQAMSDDLKESLQRFNEENREATSNQIRDLKNARKSMSAEQRELLEQQLNSLRNQVDDLRKQLNAEHKQLAFEQANMLSDFKLTLTDMTQTYLDDLDS